MRKFLARAIAALMVLLSVASAFAEGGETGDFIVLSGSPEDGAEAGTAGGNGSGRSVAMTRRPFLKQAIHLLYTA